MNKKFKVVLVTGISALLVVAILVGIFWFLGRGGEPVKVAPVTMFAGWIGNESSQSGTVAAEGIQKVYTSDTQTVTEILVTEGQRVTEGTPLLRYDTTLTDIQVERQALTVQQLELNIQWANDQLKQINAMKPYTPPPETQQPTEPTTQEPVPLPEEELPYFRGGWGTEEDPYYYLCAPGMIFDEAYLESFLPQPETDPPENTEPDEDSEPLPPTDGEQTDDDAEEPVEEERVWIIFEVRELNALNGGLIHSVGLTLSRDEETGKLQFTVFAPPPEPEPEPAPEPEPWIDTSSGYTSAEIASMRKEKQREIRDLKLQKEMAELDLKRMQAELENGYVYAKIDGVVTNLLDAETVVMTGEAIMAISDGGSYYVETVVSELDLADYPVGSTVEMMLWTVGEKTEGTVQSISDTPVDEGMFYVSGNQNVSLYTIVISLDASAQVMEGDYVEVYFSDNTAEEDTLCIETRFIRTDEAGSYVYLRGENGKLRKQYVTTGAVQWGYTVIRKGLTEADWIAFPYGKDVKTGADTVESENWDDFTYYGST